MSAEELRTLYFYGIPVRDRSGKVLSNDVYTFFIQAAQELIEKYLSIKLTKQIHKESIDFYLDEFRQFGYMDTSYPVVKPFECTGWLGQVKQLEYPTEWLTSRKTSDHQNYYKRIFIVPFQNAMQSVGGSSILYSGVLPYTNMMGFNTIPNYFIVTYCTGFDRIPSDLFHVIGMMAAIGVFNIAGDIVFGQPGLSNYSLSIDGLSQSIGTTSSAGNSAFSSRIKMYQAEVKDTLEKLKSYYKGIICSSM